jgi:hypothetical protein
MTVKIIDTEKKEYLLNQLTDFMFSFSKNESGDADYRLNLMNMSEIPLENKIEVFNLFERQLKYIPVDQVIIEAPIQIENAETNESYSTLFDSKMYDLTFKTVNYYAEYGVPGNADNRTKPFEQIILSFVFYAN